jgi:hypothetical protein
MSTEQPIQPSGGVTTPTITDVPEWEKVKWRDELALREREIALKEAELELRRKEHAVAGWRSPLVVAVLAAALGAAGNAVVSYTNASLERQLEDQKSEQQRLLEVIKTGDPDSAAENLEFLLDAGLITEPARVTKLREFLTNREPGSGPALPSPSNTGSFSGGIIGADDAVPASTLPATNALARVVSSVGQLRVKMSNGRPGMCTGFVTGPHTVVTAGHCVEGAISGSFFLREGGHEVEHALVFPPEKLVSGPTADLNYAIVARHRNERFNTQPLQLSAQPPRLNQPLALILFRGDTQQLVVVGEECRAISVGGNEIKHRCDTGPGSSGAPVLSADGTVVYGVHVRRERDGGVATRADRVKANIDR